jgi:tripartite-type tricarboxylate transporter receptor subunit TctC
LSEQVTASMANDTARMRLLELGLSPATATLSQFATRIHSESEKWAPVLRTSRLPLAGKDEG